MNATKVLRTNNMESRQQMGLSWKRRFLASKWMPQSLQRKNAGLIRRLVPFLGILLTLLLGSNATLAGSVAGTGGSTEITQILNNVQLAESYAQQVQQYQNQLMQYETMVRNLASNPAGVIAPDLSRMASNASRVTAMGQDISSSMARVDSNFANTFKSPVAASYATKFSLWTDTSNNALKSSMLNAGLQREQFKDDASALQGLTSSVASSQGNLAALQALGSLNAAQVQESMKLRDLISQQQVAQNTYLAAQSSKDQAKQENNRAIMGLGDKPMPNANNYQ